SDRRRMGLRARVTLVLLDTHVWLWVTEKRAGRIGRRTMRLIARAESAGSIRVSALSLFEFAVLDSRGRVRLSRPRDQRIREVLETGGLIVADVSAAIARDAAGLPRDALPDPLDRFLVATARLLDATFITCDRRILDYAAAARSVRVHNGAS